MIKLAQIKDKDRILKAAREKRLVPSRRTSITLSEDLSGEILQAKRAWEDRLRVLTETETVPTKKVLPHEDVLPK